MPRSVRVISPSRLHFGLWSLGDGAGRQFGGVGAMIDRPGVTLHLEEDSQFSAVGPASGRVSEFARRWAAFHGQALPCCKILVREVIPEHAGLGSGTQLALAVAAGLSALVGLPSQTPQELAMSVGRGLRSAVGTYGFVFGGMIVEQGKLASEPISPLDCRIDLSEEWRFVLLRPEEVTGLAGEDEAAAFASLPTVAPEVTERLIAEVRDRLVPAAAMGDFPLFAQSVYAYGRLSGECFAARQGGPFNGPLVTLLIERVRQMGHAGVGQSSWGPTVFVAVPSQDVAEELVGELAAADFAANVELLVAAPSNRGALVEVRGVGELAGCG